MSINQQTIAATTTEQEVLAIVNEKLGGIDQFAGMFITEKGSIYLYNKRGQTVRKKAVIQGHNAHDVGWKDASELTFYVDKEEASEIASASFLPNHYAIVIREHEGRKMLHICTVESRKITKSIREVELYFKPSLGLSPVEFFGFHSLHPSGTVLTHKGMHTGHHISAHELH